MVAVRLEIIAARSVAANPDKPVVQRSIVPIQEILAVTLVLALLDGDAAVLEHAIQMEENVARMEITANLAISAF
jgi:hypothetical protein